MKILVTGGRGQVAQSLAVRYGDGRLVFAERPEFDLADAGSIERVVAAVHPDLIVSAAAYTAVDKAEDEPELAMKVNGEGPGVLARAAAAIDAQVIHLSTDYVFDGSLPRPYREDDPVGPVCVYGVTKLAGEDAVRASGARHAILRTSWVYSPFGHNFVKTMLRLAEQGTPIRAVEDQFGCPSSALDIADAVMTVANRWQAQPGHGADSTYHLAGTGGTNWADFARAIFAESRRRGGPSADVIGISSTAYPTKAVRPVNSRLDTARFRDTFGVALPHWRMSLPQVVARLV